MICEVNGKCIYNIWENDLNVFFRISKMSSQISTNRPTVMELEQLKNKIETMSKTHHIEILKIIKKNPTIKLNENKSGVFINISLLPSDVLSDIKEYLNYIDVQDESLMSIERIKEGYATLLANER